MAKVMWKQPNEWKTIGSTPVEVPINKSFFIYPYTVTDSLGLWPNDNSNYKSVGSITIPVTGKYKFYWSIAIADDLTAFAYDLRKNGTSVKSGSAGPIENLDHQMTCSEGDTIELFYKSQRIRMDGYNYDAGFGTGLIAYYDYNDQ